MKSFKYTLDTSSKKFNCPGCNKRTFVRYVDNESKTYLNEDLGRCDRESKCKYHKAPEKETKAFKLRLLSIGSISDKAFKVTDENGVISIIPKSIILERENLNLWLPEWFLKSENLPYLGCQSKSLTSSTTQIINTQISIEEPTLEISYHSLELLDEMYFQNPVDDNLLIFLKEFFTREEIFKAMQKYYVTGSNKPWPNSTVFWQIDEKEKIRGGKIMLYNASKGKRIKQPYNHINWMHKVQEEADFNLNQCLFGLHQIVDDQISTIAIVESEKTAIIMSLVLPQFLWLATGNKQNLKEEFLKPVKRRKLVLYPDKGEFEFWKNKADQINEKGYSISVSDLLETEENPEGFDLADMVINEKQSNAILN